MSDQFERLRAALAGHYDVERPLGQGGMAFVYRATDTRHARPVAMKVLKPELSATIGAERFLREIKVAAQLQHPNILPLYDSGSADSLLYYVMPFIEGESLRDRLEREHQLQVEDAVRIVREAAEALQFAHDRHIVHRDIKPENILLQGGHALVADFGIAKAVEVAGGQKLTETGMAVGTPHYMSPEQGLGGELDGRSDQYSLGCVLYELLVGQPPFSGPNPMALLARHAMEQVPSLRVVRQAIPDKLEDATLRTLEKTPADRFGSMREFANVLGELEAALALERVSGRRGATPRTPMPSAIGIARTPRTPFPGAAIVRTPQQVPVDSTATVTSAILARAGLRDSARAVIASARAGADIDPTKDLYHDEAFAHLQAGDHVAALAALKVYLSANPDVRDGLAEDPGWWFRELATEPGFKAAVGTRP